MKVGIPLYKILVGLKFAFDGNLYPTLILFPKLTMDTANNIFARNLFNL